MNEPAPSNPGGPPSTGSGFDFNQPTIISLCFLGGFVTGIRPLLGAVLGHIWQGENKDAWADSHFTYLIRTFWIGLVGFVVSAVLTIALIGILLLPLVGIWVGVRSVMSLIKAQKQEPMPDPNTLLF